METQLVKIPIYINKEYGNAETHEIQNADGTTKFIKKYKTVEIENFEYFKLKQEYFNLVERYQENKFEEFAGGMPSTMEKNCLSQILRTDKDGNLVYGITLKVDGERYLMFLSSDGIIYFIDRALIFYRLDPIKILKTKPFLIDGEMVFHKTTNQYEFLIFDILFFNGESCIEQPYYIRYDIANYAIVNVLKGLSLDLLISLKKWVLINELLKTQNIYNHVLKITNEPRDNGHKLVADGLILQPFDTPYVTFGPWNKYNNILFKWKPPSDLTIDFQIKIISKTVWELLTRSGQNYDIPQGEGDPVHSICNPTLSDIKNYSDGDVAEFKYKPTNNPQGNKFIIVRPRPEKNANSLNSIMSIMNVIHNPFNLDILEPAVSSVISKKNTKEQLLQYSHSSLILCLLKESLFFTKNEIAEIKKIYSMRLQNNTELEFRILKNNKSLDKFTFYYLFDFFMKNFKNTTLKYTVDVVQTDYESKRVYRSTYENMENMKNKKSITNEYKLKVKDFTILNDNKLLYNNLNCKLQLSQEIPVKIITNNGTIREKTRYSYLFGLWRIDITKVITDLLKESYEIECECINLNVTFEEFIKSFSDLYIIILKNSSYC